MHAEVLQKIPLEECLIWNDCLSQITTYSLYPLPNSANYFLLSIEMWSNHFAPVMANISMQRLKGLRTRENAAHIGKDHAQRKRLDVKLHTFPEFILLLSSVQYRLGFFPKAGTKITPLQFLMEHNLQSPVAKIRKEAAKDLGTSSCFCLWLLVLDYINQSYSLIWIPTVMLSLLILTNLHS